MHEQALRSRTEANLARARKYESLAILTAGIAHDFNNSLHAILGDVEGIAGSPDAEERAARIRTTVEDSAGLCRRLLAFAGHASMNPEIVDMNVAIAEVIPFLTPLAGDVPVRWEPGPGLPPVEVDPVELRQWVIGLVTRAIESTDGSGDISVSTFLDRPVAACGEERPSFRVIDRGRGIPEESLDRVFDPFFQSVGRNRGMDLAAMRGSIESIGGAIRVESVPGIRTAFTVMLPAASDDRTSPPPEPEAVIPDGCEIALVDDDDRVRTVTCTMMETLGCRVTCWHDGETFLAAIPSGLRPSCVLLDMTMPGLPAVRCS